MRKLILWSQAHPLLVITILVVCSVVSALNLSKLRVDNSPGNMMMKGDPAKAVYYDTLDKFGSDTITVVFAKDPRLFTPEKLTDLQNLTFDLEDISGIYKVESLFSVSNIRNEDGFLNTNPLIDWIPETPDEAQKVKENAISNDILVENLISESGDATAINVYMETKPDDPNFAIEISDRIEEVVQQYEGKFETLFQIGTPYNVSSQNKSITVDMKTIFPLSALVLISLLIITMRSFSAAVLPILTSGFSILFTFGFMGLTGIPFTVLTIIVPSLILVIGSTEDIHILSEYMEGLKKTSDKKKAVQYMANKVGTAIMLTAVTTVFGFLAITVNKISILRQFGMSASFGLFVNPLITAMLGPVYLSYFGPRKSTKRAVTVIDNLLDFIADFILRIIKNRRIIIVVLFIGISVIAGYFGFHVNVDNNSLGFFKEGSPILQRVDILKESMAGSVTFYVRISGEPGDFHKPENLAKVDKLQQYMADQGWFDKTVSFTDYLKLIHREMNEGNPDYYTIPEGENTVDEYLLFLNWDDIDKYITTDFSDLVILVRHNINSSKELNGVLAEFKKGAASIIPKQFTLSLTGENILINNAVTSIATGQVMGILLVTVVIFVIMSLLFMNVKAGFISLLPNLFPISLIFGIMTLLKIPLNTGTCMVAAISVGIAVDDTVHIMSRYHKEMRQCQDQNKSLYKSIRAEILPVFSTSIALGIGFSVIVFSSFVPILQFGILSAMVMVFALTSDMIFTPALLSYTQLITLWDMLVLQLHKEVITGSKLFENLKKWQIKKIVLLGKMSDIAQGELAVTQGEFGKTMFLILDGEATVFVKKESDEQEVVLAKLSPGDIFGEIALINPCPRTANIRADTPVQCIEFDWDGLDRMRKIYPRIAANLLLNISKILGNQLASTDDLILKSDLK